MATILVVEDLEPTRIVIATYLEKRGYKVLQAENGKETLEKCYSLKPDLVVLDIGLPDITGFDICRTLKSSIETETLKVVILSASHVEFEDRVQGLLAGAEEMLLQPLPFSLLEETIAAILVGSYELKKPLDQALYLEARGWTEAARDAYEKLGRETTNLAVAEECKRGLERLRENTTTGSKL